MHFMYVVKRTNLIRYYEENYYSLFSSYLTENIPDSTVKYFIKD